MQQLDFSCGSCSPAQCFKRLRQTFGVWNTPSKSTLQRWFAEWRKGRTAFKSLRHNSGRLRSTVTLKKSPQLVGLPKYVQTGTRRFLLNRGYKQETRRRKLKTSKTDFHQAENTRLYMIEETDVNGK